MIRKNKIIKLISFLLIISIIAPSVLFFRSQQAQAYAVPTAEIGPFGWISKIFLGSTSISSSTSSVANTTNTAISIKNVALEILRQMVMVVERKLLQEMTKSTINWINSGFHGAPLFLENPESFFRDIGKYEIKTLIDLTGYNSDEFPFGKDVALDIIGAYKRQFATNAQYTLSRAMTDPVLLKKYRTDFNFGGWNGFLVNTQYPQNNYLGYKMMVTEELARKLEGTYKNETGRVADVLQQGMGFLSPQTCADNNGNNDYNKVIANQFKRPTFKSTVEFIPPDYNQYDSVDGSILPEDPNNPIDKLAIERAARAKYEDAKEKEKADWIKKNTCKKLVATTPGSVVANQITSAMGSQFRQSELAAAMGNSISAILDALLNHFMQKGLNALASKVNPPPQADTWDYKGNTLGSPEEITTNSTWNTGPDVPIVLADFKKTVDDGINNTNTELKLMYNELPTKPGISQVLGNIWPKIRELDKCLPGPDLGWQGRIDNEMSGVAINQSSAQTNNSNNLFNLTVPDQDQAQTNATLQMMDELKFAVDSLKDWINNKMMFQLPSSSTYLSAINDLKNIYQQSDELTDKIKIKTNALTRLESIKGGLNTLTIQPTSGSNEEILLIDLKRKYDAITLDTSNFATLNDTQNELDIAKDKSINLNKLITKCDTERKASGWSIPANGDYSNFNGATSIFNLSSVSATEQDIFCNEPIEGGYSHKSFINENGVTHPEIPLVNAMDVLRHLYLNSSIMRTDIPVNIKISCSTVYKASVLDYKGNLPGITTVVEPYIETPIQTGG